MRPADIPNDIALRDILYDKVKGSKLMAFSFHYYEEKVDDHPEKTYEYLMNMISRHIRLKREERNREMKNQGLKHLTSRYKALPATTDNEAAKAKAPGVPKAKAPPADPPRNPAAPVLADPKNKLHDYKGKGKGKGKGQGKRKRERSRQYQISQCTEKPQPRRRRYPVDSTLGPEQLVPKGEIVSTAIPKTHRERIVARGIERACVTRLCKVSAQREKIVSIYNKKALAVVKASVKAASAKASG